MRSGRALVAAVVGTLACRATGNPGGASAVERGRALFANTHDSLPAYARSALSCNSCHRDGGRDTAAIPIVGAAARYPRYLARAGRTISIEDRMNFCLMRSLAGRALPDSSRAMRDLVRYVASLTGSAQASRVADSLAPPVRGDTGRGAALFATTCVRCHGADGEGTAVAPPLWGPASYSIGASMARVSRAARFIQEAMPADRPGTLAAQDAADIAAYVDSHARPDLAGKDQDWPKADAPADVPYATRGHVPAHPVPVLAAAGPRG